MKDFIYSVNINKVDPAATAFRLQFGVSDDSFWLLKVDVDNQVISLGKKDKEDLKTADYAFTSSRDYNIRLIVNDSTAKVFIDESSVATLTFAIDGYVEGEVVDNLEASLLNYSQKNITSLNSLTGDIFCGGYTVSKVINLTEGNYKLSADQYTISGGVLSINGAYLNTLETNTTYKFRAVTSVTDFDFYVSTEEVGAEVNSLVAKYYRGDDVRLELSQNTAVSKALIDNEEVAFTQKDSLVTIASKDLSSVGSGEHNVKLFTANGRPETKFSLYEVVEVIPEPKAAVNHTFFFVDIAIFGALILGYLGFTLFKKRVK